MVVFLIFVVVKEVSSQQKIMKNYSACKEIKGDSTLVNDNLYDRYSNLFLNAYINRHVHADYLKMI